jgi:hypothetical protein
MSTFVTATLPSPLKVDYRIREIKILFQNPGMKNKVCGLVYASALHTIFLAALLQKA